MEQTVGKTDKLIRIIIGIILLIVAFAFHVGQIAAAILAIIGTIALMTAISGLCLLYSLLGINTCKTKSNNTEAPKPE